MMRKTTNYNEVKLVCLCVIQSSHGYKGTYTFTTPTTGAIDRKLTIKSKPYTMKKKSFYNLN